MGYFSSESVTLQPWKLEHILLLVFSIIFFIVLRPITRFLLERIVPQFNKFDESKKLDWISRWISTFHAIIFAGLSFYILFISGQVFRDIWTGGLRTSCPVVFPTLIFSCGYFIVDCFYCIKHFFDVPTIAHHLGATAVCFVIVSYQIGPFYMIWFGLTEASTPFVNMRSFLSDLDMKDSMLYVVNGIAMWLGFLIFRIPMIFTIPYYIFGHSAPYFKNEAPLIHFHVAAGTYLLISCLNLYWFYLITKGLLKALSSSGGKGNDKVTSSKVASRSEKQERAKTKKED